MSGLGVRGAEVSEATRASVPLQAATEAGRPGTDPPRPAPPRRPPSAPPAMCPERAQPLASQRVVGKGKLLLSSFCRDDNWPCFRPLSGRFRFDRSPLLITLNLHLLFAFDFGYISFKTYR